MHEARRWLGPSAGGAPDVLRLSTLTLPEPQPGQVLVAVRACGMNPADWKGLSRGRTDGLPITLGFEVAGVIAAVPEETEIPTGPASVGDEVVAFQLRDGYSSALLAPATDVFHKPAPLGFPESANLLLVGTTAAEMLSLAKITASDTVLVHAAAGALGASVVQQALHMGARVIGTAGPRDLVHVESFGATAVRYGPGLEERVRAAAPDGVDAAIDAVGVDEAIDVSLALVADRRRIVSAAAFDRAHVDGFILVGAQNPGSPAFRRSARASVLKLAADRHLRVPIATEYAFDDAPRALQDLKMPHAFGKFALVL